MEKAFLERLRRAGRSLAESLVERSEESPTVYHLAELFSLGKLFGERLSFSREVLTLQVLRIRTSIEQECLAYMSSVYAERLATAYG